MTKNVINFDLSPPPYFLHQSFHLEFHQKDFMNYFSSGFASMCGMVGKEFIFNI